ncbi:MAG: putative membrane protein [Arenicella sp.]|jgi:uncharacterized membrane protein
MNAVINTSSVVSSEYKTHALVSYILLALGLFTAIPLLFGAIWAIIKKKGALGTIYHSHLVNITRIFWWSLLWLIIGGILTTILVGFAILGIAWLWGIYRVLNGFIKILADQPYPI